MKDILVSLYTKINFRIKRPILLLYDMGELYHKIKYYGLSIIDPAPPTKRKESAIEFFDRIDPKYGLRFYEYMRSKRMDIDLEYAFTEIEKNYIDKKAKKLMKDFIMTCVELDRKNEEFYQRYLIRSELLKSQNS